jgi:hypothetical protein
MASVANAKNNPDGERSLKIDFTDQAISSRAGLVFAAQMGKQLGLNRALSAIQLKRRERGISDANASLCIIYSLCTGMGSLADLDALACDKAVVQATGLAAALPSRRASEHLARFTPQTLSQLQAAARTVSHSVIATRAQALQAQLGYVPVFVDGSAIEVQGKHFEGAKRGYSGDWQYWLHGVFVGDVWASSRLHEGATDVASSWQEQLERDVLPCMSADVRPWLRMDNAYYRGEVVAWARRKGWDYSISVTNDKNKEPILRQVRGDSGHVWRRINDDEQATVVHHTPQGWDKKTPQAYVVVCTQFENNQALLDERYSVIAVSRTDVSVKELVHRHRAKQGQENALKGPLIEMDLHHPPCRGLLANQAFYTLGQIAQVLLMALKYQTLPTDAHDCGLGRLMQWLIGVAGKFTRSGRQCKLWLAKSNFKLAWLAACANKLGFG